LSVDSDHGFLVHRTRIRGIGELVATNRVDFDHVPRNGFLRGVAHQTLVFVYASNPVRVFKEQVKNVYLRQVVSIFSLFGSGQAHVLGNRRLPRPRRRGINGEGDIVVSRTDGVLV
jgi:hypothetical protein